MLILHEVSVWVHSLFCEYFALGFRTLLQEIVRHPKYHLQQCLVSHWGWYYFFIERADCKYNFYRRFECALAANQGKVVERLKCLPRLPCAQRSGETANPHNFAKNISVIARTDL